MKVNNQNKHFIQTLSPINTVSEEFAKAGTDERGAVFTRREVVDFILDLSGYVPSRKLQNLRLLEPSFGCGDFLIPAIERLMSSLKNQLVSPNVTTLKECIRAVELHAESYQKTRKEVYKILNRYNLTTIQIEELLNTWLIQGDFLLTEFDQLFTHVVGNPPYIRNEAVPSVLMTEYRKRFQTIYDRADIYVPFIEYSLSLLCEGGTLGFICADRWMKNRYGGPLRKLIAEQYHLRIYVDMVGSSAFHSEVIAYPAITIIAKEPTGPTTIIKRPEIDSTFLQEIFHTLKSDATAKGVGVETTLVNSDDSPWVFGESSTLNLVRRLERDFPTLEEVGCKVGIGVATGADRVFIAQLGEMDVEEDRKIPLITTKDIQTGEINWKGYGVINPFDKKGKLVSLAEYPKLRAYLELHRDIIEQRHISKKNPHAWYRTIDRINIELVTRPKLLIPDIKSYVHIVYEKGKFYPHHNLYYITSQDWDLESLSVILRSGIARLFIETYSTRMHGNCLRFQAQYLRRIRIPHWSAIPDNIRQEIRRIAKKDDKVARNHIVSVLYSLSPTERAIIEK